ncbi:MAG: GIY-YIG nuclease family protein [Cyanobacteria bacterium]|nr:GIY-YIG nuclease family protein [Cyanobacteria bacterium bin.51]
MTGSGRQGELFPAGAGSGDGPGTAPCALLPLRQRQLLAWQNRLASFQQPLFEALGTHNQAQGEGSQGQLFAMARSGRGPDPDGLTAHFNPLALTPQSLQFWRWPQQAQNGAALYVVIDQPPHLNVPLLLYIGETSRADLRWKGDHDCKTYLAAYGEALQQAELKSLASIRFWADVPVAARPRQALEQALIRRWQPPFNKETRQRWATPFTSDLG